MKSIIKTITEQHSTYSDDDKKLLNKFIEKVMYVKCLYYSYYELYEQDDGKTLRKTALRFFSDLNILLVDAIILEMSKLTDPPKQYKGDMQNLSFENLIETIPWDYETKSSLKCLNEYFTTMRTYIRDARNELIAHNDKEAYLSEIRLGAFPEEEGNRFFETMEEFCDICNRSINGESLGHMYPGTDGDVIDLKKALEKAVAFDEFMKKGTLEEVEKLDNILMNIC